MPLRSVEAATRDDAIAAAREQFGPTARVVGVRRVRSGGVLGFFATERYVAEVAPDPTGRPAVPAPPPPADRRHARTTSRRPTSPPRWPPPHPARARAPAPARNGAAAWAAEAAASRDAGRRPPTDPRRPHPAPAAARPRPRGRTPARRSTRRRARGRRRAGQRARRSAGRPAAGSRAPAYARGRFPRAASSAPAAPARRTAPGPRDDADDGRRGFARPLPSSARPPRSPPRSRGWWPGTGTSARRSRKPWTTPQRRDRAADGPAAGRPGPAHQQTHRWRRLRPARRRKRWEIRSSRPSTPLTSRWRRPRGPPSPRSRPSAVSSREEAIAEVLRAALAQGHSDEALAGILRKVLAGASPQTALTEPEAAAPVRAAPGP